MCRIHSTALLVVLFIIVFADCISLRPAAAESQDSPDAQAKKTQPDKKPADPYAWQSLFDGKTLTGWRPTNSGGEGRVHVEDGSIRLERGETITGVVYTGKPPRMDFEISLEAMRVDGSDFFATTTFPVGKSYCSLVVGGWSGVVVGLSNVDYYDASDNITTSTWDLKAKRWYRVRLRVSQSRIEAWIDKDKVVDLATKGHKFGTRFEVDCCRPLGIASWCTTAALRNIRIRCLSPTEIAEAAARRTDE